MDAFIQCELWVWIYKTSKIFFKKENISNLHYLVLQYHQNKGLDL